MNDGACRGVSLSVFFPDRGESAAPAKAICDSCPVWRPCLDFAVSDDSPADGIIAGLTGNERRRLRVELRRDTPRPPVAALRRRRGPVLLPVFPRIKVDTPSSAWTRAELLEARAERPAAT